MKGRLEKWKWLWPKLSFRGRSSLLNNLVASALWHRMACTDPPNGLLAKLQAVAVDFFWTKYHWVPQSVLFLPGGRRARDYTSGQQRSNFRLQFIQRFFN